MIKVKTRVQVNFQEPLPRPWLAPECYLVPWPQVGSLEIQISLKYWQGRKFGRRNIASRFRELGLAKSGVEVGR
jgi:hypothetical protein